MKTTGAVWTAYLASWPEGQWYDDSDETINGVSGDEYEAPSIPDDAVVEFSSGVVYADRNDHEGTALPTHFRRWEKAQTHATVVVLVPKDKLDDLKAMLKTIGGKVTL